jgi:site-specific DNA-methyltransferase (adenine-specific)
MINQVFHGDCLELMQKIGDRSIDMILCDLPYGITACKWDQVIPFEPLWEQYKRIIKPNGAIVLTASQPFTSQLVMSNPKWFRYEWIWSKNVYSGFLNANKKPLNSHENILVFYETQPTYNPQFRDYSEATLARYPKGKTKKAGGKNIESIYGLQNGNKGDVNHDRGAYPITVQEIKGVNNANSARLHPTQKPVDLFSYLIKTYTNEGDLVLDNCAGSGTSAIAAINTNRNYILIEKEAEYIEVINKRIAEHTKQLVLEVAS